MRLFFAGYGMFSCLDNHSGLLSPILAPRLHFQICSQYHHCLPK
uniref:Uncharacterized protein n=1 Tax=Rhizophora mucronata TaxID=61149 RepID=A0A2P2K7T2_RHIMU